jgi:hypothetical protein
MTLQDPGLAAYYSFNEGAGTLLHDISGNGNDGQIFGAHWIKRRAGYCLEFNGIDNYVDCGGGPSLDLRGAITLEAWVLLDAGLGEAGIAGKHYESYFLTYYADGKCYWYINQSGIANNANTPVLAGSWHHLATTFDAVTLSVYLDGKLADSQPSKSAPGINPGQHFFMGVTNPTNTAAPYLKGLIGEVRVYNRGPLRKRSSGSFPSRGRAS